MDELRTIEQNKRMWAMLTDLSNQVKWPVNGYMVNMSPDDWKHVMTAGLVKERRVAQGLDGGFVILGQYTHQMRKTDMSEGIELMIAFGAEHNVRWTDEEKA